MNLRESLEKRFYRYVGISSQSDFGADSIPSSEGQLKLGRLLAEEMKELGLVDVFISDTGVVYGHLPARFNKGSKIDPARLPKVGWVAHLDTVDVKLSPDIYPKKIENYQGGDICQNEEKQIYIKENEHPELMDYLGQDIIVSDGTSVLGADDKAAIANIMTALEVLKEDEAIEHGEIYIAFVPDEEIGLKGAKTMDFSLFPVDFAYTIDCCSEGELIYETFNAGYAKVKVKGIPAHPMSSKNNLVNPAMVCTDLINLFDRGQTPEYTEGKEGYLWVTAIKCDEVDGYIEIDIRDHDLQKYNAKKEYLKEAVKITGMKHPKAEIDIEIFDLYSNISDALTEESKVCISYMYEAMQALGIVPKTIAMRGGTDGSFISTKGIPTPNYFTGACNFHSSCEFLPMDSFENSCKMTLKLIELIAKGVGDSLSGTIEFKI